MRKIIGLTVSSLCLGLYLGATWWIGNQIEARYFDQNNWELASSFQSELLANDLMVTMTPIAVQRDFFSSQGQFEVSVSDVTSDESLSLRFVQQIEHGPFPRTRLGRLQLAPVLAQGQLALDVSEPEEWLAEALQEPLLTEILAAVSVHFTVKLNGATQVALDVAPVSLQQDGVDVALSAGDFSAGFDAEGGYLFSTGSFQALQVAIEEEGLGERIVFSIKDFSLNSKGEQTKNGLRTKDVYHIGLLGIEHGAQGKQGVDVKLEDINWRSHTVFANNSELRFVDTIESAFEVNRALFNDVDFGALDIEITGQNLDLQALSDWGEAMQMQAPYQANQALQTLLNANPSLELKQLKLSNEAGALALSLLTSVSAAPAYTGQALVMKSEASLDVDKQVIPHFLRQVAAVDEGSRNAVVQAEAEYNNFLEALLSLDLLVEKPEQYSLSVAFENTNGPTFRFNGEDVPEEALLMLLGLLM